MSDRKYRQRGYDDDGGIRRGGAPTRSPRERREGPRGRGLGAPGKAVLKCSRCGAALASTPVQDESCTACGSDLHTCTNCRHFDSTARFECRQPIEKRVTAKAKKNDCELFEPKLVQEVGSRAASDESSTDAKSAFDDLFDF